MTAWNPESLSKTFKSVAENAERYSSEIHPKMAKQRSYRGIYDRHVAKFIVYDRLHERTFLDTRELLLAELRRMRDQPPEGFGINDQAQFRDAYISEVEQLIASYEAKAS